jgi:hypothetical protein
MIARLVLASVLAGTMAAAFASAASASAASAAADAAKSLVYNGSFREVRDGVPVGWQTAGRAEIAQKLSVANDPQRGSVARLDCTHFEGGTPDSHVMLAQVGHVSVQRGKWYRLSLWMREEGMTGGSVNVALSDTRTWGETGLYRAFSVEPSWRQCEVTFQSTRDLPGADSRLQIWFGSTGTLYVSDVSLEPAAPVRKEWHPQLPLDGVTNAVPNSSFECGGAGWGCISGQSAGWGTELFHLVGEWDQTRGFHGKSSWKLSIPARSAPMLYFDYYDPMAQPVRSVLLGHEGWVPVERGKPYTFSAYVMGDRPGTPVRIIVQEADGGRQARAFTAGTEWSRVEYTFTAKEDYACGFVGLDFSRADTTVSPAGTLWVDAVQFEAGAKASPYQPLQPIESFVSMDPPGNVFTDPAAGAGYHLRAYNDGDAPATLKGTTEITDFREATAAKGEPSIAVPAKGAASMDVQTKSSRLGFFRLKWRPEGGMEQDLRYAVIQPPPAGDSVFGMNHAFGDGYLLPLAHQAGLRWWRDWSTQWRIVQSGPDAPFDFAIPDKQIYRVLDDGGFVDVLLPFPSAPWAAKADDETLKKANEMEAGASYRMRTAFRPASLDQWADYVRASVQHYAPRTRVFEILNESLFTSYSLPQRVGYGMKDYIDMLRTAYGAAKQADPGCTVVGGIAIPAPANLAGDFITEGGTKYCDVMNYHDYPSGGWPEASYRWYEKRLEQMQAAGGVKPIWMTEFGIYGEDAPAFTPFTVGDNAMNNAMRPTELAAAADLVRYAAVFFAGGVRKVFYHAGTCEALNQSSTGNMFFEYGGAPRKQYAALAALADMIGPDFVFVRKWTQPEWLTAFEFRSRGRTVVIAWTRAEQPQSLDLPAGYRALDLMGNELPERPLTVDDIPIYLVSP